MKITALSFFTTIAVLMLPLVPFHYSMEAQIDRVSSLAASDVDLWKTECRRDEGRPTGCSQVMLNKAQSVIGVVLGAAERTTERGGKLTEADIVSIQMLWRTAYSRESDDSLYSIVANVCANSLGGRCPDFLEIASWRFQEKRIEILHRDYRA